MNNHGSEPLHDKQLSYISLTRIFYTNYIKDKLGEICKNTRKFYNISIKYNFHHTQNEYGQLNYNMI